MPACEQQLGNVVPRMAGLQIEPLPTPSVRARMYLAPAHNVETKNTPRGPPWTCRLGHNQCSRTHMAAIFKLEHCATSHCSCVTMPIAKCSFVVVLLVVASAVITAAEEFKPERTKL